MGRPRVKLTIRNVASKEREVLLTQKQYIVDTFRDSGAPEKPCVQTPVPKGWVVDRRTMPKVPNKKNVAYFRRIYGKVLHIMRCTRPDIAYPVSELGRIAASPSDEHIRILQRVCQYLYNTRGLGLRFGGAAVREKRNERNRIKVKVMQDFVLRTRMRAGRATQPTDDPWADTGSSSTAAPWRGAPSGSRSPCGRHTSPRSWFYPLWYVRLKR